MAYYQQYSSAQKDDGDDCNLNHSNSYSSSRPYSNQKDKQQIQRNNDWYNAPDNDNYTSKTQSTNMNRPPNDHSDYSSAVTTSLQTSTSCLDTVKYADPQYRQSQYMDHQRPSLAGQFQSSQGYKDVKPEVRDLERPGDEASYQQQNLYNDTPHRQQQQILQQQQRDSHNDTQYKQQQQLRVQQNQAPQHAHQKEQPHQQQPQQSSAYEKQYQQQQSHQQQLQPPQKQLRVQQNPAPQHAHQKEQPHQQQPQQSSAYENQYQQQQSHQQQLQPPQKQLRVQQNQTPQHAHQKEQPHQQQPPQSSAYKNQYQQQQSHQQQLQPPQKQHQQLRVQQNQAPQHAHQKEQPYQQPQQSTAYEKQYQQQQSHQQLLQLPQKQHQQQRPTHQEHESGDVPWQTGDDSDRPSDNHEYPSSGGKYNTKNNYIDNSGNYTNSSSKYTNNNDSNYSDGNYSSNNENNNNHNKSVADRNQTNVHSNNAPTIKREYIEEPDSPGLDEAFSVFDHLLKTEIDKRKKRKNDIDDMLNKTGDQFVKDCRKRMENKPCFTGGAQSVSNYYQAPVSSKPTTSSTSTFVSTISASSTIPTALASNPLLAECNASILPSQQASTAIIDKRKKRKNEIEDMLNKAGDQFVKDCRKRMENKPCFTGGAPSVSNYYQAPVSSKPTSSSSTSTFVSTISASSTIPTTLASNPLLAECNASILPSQQANTAIIPPAVNFHQGGMLASSNPVLASQYVTTPGFRHPFLQNIVIPGIGGIQQTSNLMPRVVQLSSNQLLQSQLPSNQLLTNTSMTSNSSQQAISVIGSKTIQPTVQPQQQVQQRSPVFNTLMAGGLNSIPGQPRFVNLNTTPGTSKFVNFSGTLGVPNVINLSGTSGVPNMVNLSGNSGLPNVVNLSGTSGLQRIVNLNAAQGQAKVINLNTTPSAPRIVNINSNAPVAVPANAQVPNSLLPVQSEFSKAVQNISADVQEERIQKKRLSKKERANQNKIVAEDKKGELYMKLMHSSKAWFDYECYEICTRRKRLIIKMNKQRKAGKEATAEATWNRINELSNSFRRLLHDKKTAFIEGLETAGDIEKICDVTLSGLLDKIVTCERRALIQERFEKSQGAQRSVMSLMNEEMREKVKKRAEMAEVEDTDDDAFFDPRVGVMGIVSYLRDNFAKFEDDVVTSSNVNGLKFCSIQTISGRRLDTDLSGKWTTL